MTTKKLKVGMIGLGEQSTDNLLPALLLSSYARVIAICDIDPGRLQKIGMEKGIPGLYIDFREMLDKEALDAVVVCSFPEIHYEVARYAIAKGIHVFVEKPPVSNISQLNDLIDLSVEKGVRTGVGMNFSYTDCHEIISNVIREDEFGDMSFISIEHISSKPTSPLWDLDSVMESFLLAQLIHPLDYILSLGGKYNALNVYCSGGLSSIFMQIMIEFENAVIGCLKCGTFYPRFKHTIEVVSKNGNTITVRDLSLIEVTQKNGNAPFGLKSKNCATIFTPSPLKAGYSKAGYGRELDTFFQNILFGHPYRHSFVHMLPVYEILAKIGSLLREKEGDTHNIIDPPLNIHHYATSYLSQ